MDYFWTTFRMDTHTGMLACSPYRPSALPHGILLSLRIDYYAEVSCQTCEIFERFMPLMKPLWLDEAFLSVPGSEHLFSSATEIGHKFKQMILQEVRLVTSVCVWRPSVCQLGISFLVSTVKSV
jgi:nucleotidyltransferase/DNA polymerase involved in DNA repair